MTELHLLALLGALATAAALSAATIIVDIDEPKGLRELLDRWRG